MDFFSPLIIWLLGMNILSFAVMAADKHRSMHRGHRTPEAFLFFIALLGGSLGAFLAMHLCRHKSLKARFYIGLPLLLFIQVLIFIIFILKH